MNQIWIRKSPKFTFKSDSNLNLKKIQTWISFECDLLKIMREWKVYYSQNHIVRRVAMSGAFKLDNLQTFKPHLIKNHANFFSFLMGSQYLSPSHRANIEDWEFSPLWENCISQNDFHSFLNWWDSGSPVHGTAKWDSSQPFSLLPLSKFQLWMRLE